MVLFIGLGYVSWQSATLVNRLKGDLDRAVLKQLYTDFTQKHIASIRKNTKALLAIKKKTSRDEWEKAFQQVRQQ